MAQEIEGLRIELSKKEERVFELETRLGGGKREWQYDLFELRSQPWLAAGHRIHTKAVITMEIGLSVLLEVGDLVPEHRPKPCAHNPAHDKS